MAANVRKCLEMAGNSDDNNDDDEMMIMNQMGYPYDCVSVKRCVSPL